MRSPFKSPSPPFCLMEEAQVSLSLVPGGAARRSPDRATGGVAGCETNSFPGGESPSSFPAADHTISFIPAPGGKSPRESNLRIRTLGVRTTQQARITQADCRQDLPTLRRTPQTFEEKFNEARVWFGFALRGFRVPQRRQTLLAT